jgi:hypothetical protein
VRLLSLSFFRAVSNNSFLSSPTHMYEERVRMKKTQRDPIGTTPGWEPDLSKPTLFGEERKKVNACLEKERPLLLEIFQVVPYSDLHD